MTDRGTVCLAYVHDTEVAHSWADSVVNLLLHDAANDGRIMRGGYVAMRCANSADLVEARNLAVRAFLARPAEWLFWLDTDMGFAPDTVERLLAVADPDTAPIVGALCFAQKESEPDGLSGYRTAPRVTILDLIETQDGQRFAGRTYFQPNTLTQCAATGSACILIHRSVVEQLHESNGPTWYDRIRTADGTVLGEDVSFCVRAGAHGFPIHVHTGVRTSHLKHTWVDAAQFWSAHVAPPATDSTAVVVPVYGRPGHAGPFMESLRASTGLATVYAVVGPEDTAEATEASAAAWRAAGANVLHGAGISFAEKCNTGYQSTAEPWVFVVGDDVRFRAGWLDQAQHAARSTGAHVIGTNDLGNPRVIAGEHATHLLIRREYVDEVGASWDGPKVLAHEGYRHWYVDDEIVTAAKRRNVWAFAAASVVEHLHPCWGKAPNDAVYQLGAASADKDRRLFAQRCAANP